MFTKDKEKNITTHTISNTQFVILYWPTILVISILCIYIKFKYRNKNKSNNTEYEILPLEDSESITDLENKIDIIIENDIPSPVLSPSPALTVLNIPLNDMSDLTYSSSDSDSESDNDSDSDSDSDSDNSYNSDNKSNNLDDKYDFMEDELPELIKIQDNL